MTMSMSLEEVMLQAEGYFKLFHNKNTVSLLHENHKHTGITIPPHCILNDLLSFLLREWSQNTVYHILDLIFICLKWIAWLVSIPAFPMFVIHGKTQTLAPVEMEAGMWNLN